MELIISMEVNVGKIYKYKLDSEMKVQNRQMHLSSKVLKFDIQMDGDSEEFCIWCEVDTEQPLIDVEFKIYPTGYEVDKGFNFVGTCLTYDTKFVWHLYNRIGDMVDE